MACVAYQAELRWLASGALAWVGIVVGHVLSYALAYPHPDVRAAHLAATGHEAFPIGVAAALAAVPALLILLTIRAIRGAGPRPVGRLAWHLGAIQVPAFCLLELAERGMSPARLFEDPAFLVGVAVQLVVAVTVAVLCRALVRAMRALTVRTVGPARKTISPPPAPSRTPHRPRHLVLLIGTPRRAPPLSVPV